MKPELGLVTEHKARTCIRARKEKKYIPWAAVELLPPEATSVQLLSCWMCCEEIWWCRASTYGFTGRRLRCPPMVCTLPDSGRSAPLPYRKEDQPSISNTTQPKQSWNIYATCTPLVQFLKASEIQRNAKSTLRDGEREAVLTQGKKTLWRGLQEALERLAVAVNNPTQEKIGTIKANLAANDKTCFPCS